MTATIAQRQFNPFKDFSKRTLPDIWHGLMKSQKRENLRALVYGFLVEGGEIIKVPAKKHRGAGRPRIFGKDSRAAAYRRDTSRFFNGHDFPQSGPRWTSKPVPDDSASKRDAARHAGVGHQDFSGAVIEINGKLRSRQVGFKIVEDTADDMDDASKRATIRDDLNQMAVDREHLERFKLAA
jgi:hypothetical protein